MVVRDEAPAFGKVGAIAAVGAAGTVLAAWMRLASGAAPGWPLIAAIWLAAGAMIVVLCRATMPAQLRGPLVLALIATMFFGVARADLFGAHRIGDQVAQGVDEASAARGAIDSYATGVAPACADHQSCESQSPLRQGSGGTYSASLSCVRHLAALRRGKRIQLLLEIPVEHDHLLQCLHGVALVPGNESVGNCLKRRFLPAVEPDDIVHLRCSSACIGK